MKLNPATLVITGGLGLYFLVAGGRALAQRRMTIVNPDARNAYPGLLGALIYSQRPRNPLAQAGLHVEATGAQAVARAWLYLVLGALFVVIGVLATLVENDVL